MSLFDTVSVPKNKYHVEWKPDELLAHWIKKFRRSHAKFIARNKVNQWPLWMQLPEKIVQAKGFDTSWIVLTSSGELRLGYAGCQFLGTVCS